MAASPRIELVRRRVACEALAHPSGLSGPGITFVSSPGDGGTYDPATGDGWNQELPGTNLELVIELDGHWDLQIDGRSHRTTAFAAGLVVGPARSRALGPVRLVQLCLDPLAAPAVFGVPAGELSASAVDLDALLGRDGDELRARLDDAFTDGDPVAVAERWVRERVRRPDTQPAEGAVVPADVRLACALLRASGGTLRVETLARELRCSRRHLARRFAEFVGVSPSAYARLLRFERATGALRDQPMQPLGSLAAETGYADHAHMTRDFRVLAGATPTAVAARFFA
ncbi:MAG: helix-turn-helix domain-containing protein [Solirubrobacteraceae bacterium]|nr:helix-turn-helix domain-containing protein [Solirubrobacteraceae bacterium]